MVCAAPFAPFPENSPCNFRPGLLEIRTVKTASTSSGLATQSAPAKDRAAKPTPRIAEILSIVTVLRGYGVYIAQSLEQSGLMRSFVTIAQFFGTISIDTIMAHLHRGLMRAIALQEMLRERAEQGRDLRMLDPRARSRREQPAEDAAVSEGSTDVDPADDFFLTPEYMATAAAIEAGERLARRIARNQPLTMATLPSMETILALVRRSTVGRTIAAICRDLGISPSLCTGTFWNALDGAIRFHRGSLGSLWLEVKRRERRFSKEEWKRPGLELPEETRDGIRRVLGFWVGEDPHAVAVGPGVPVAAEATGPP
jgi:hypothetical protein